MYIRKYEEDCAEEQADFCSYVRSLIPANIKNLWREFHFKESFTYDYDGGYQITIYNKANNYPEAVFTEEKDKWNFFLHQGNGVLLSIRPDIYFKYLKLKAFI